MHPGSLWAHYRARQWPLLSFLIWMRRWRCLVEGGVNFVKLCLQKVTCTWLPLNKTDCQLPKRIRVDNLYCHTGVEKEKSQMDFHGFLTLGSIILMNILKLPSNYDHLGHRCTSGRNSQKCLHSSMNIKCPRTFVKFACRNQRRFPTVAGT